VFHAVCFGWFAYVWTWHTSADAQKLPGASGFGWFLRYLTFYSYTLQTITLGLATLDDISLWLTGTSKWTQTVDDLACAIFALTHVVSIMFYSIQSATKLAVEGGHIQRPPWLDLSVHAFNTLVAWVDLLNSNHRTFSKTSERLSSVLVMVYLCYILVCRHMNGRFPYPFLNAMPMPVGFLAITCAGLALFAGAFRLGKLINTKLRTVSLSISVTERRPLQQHCSSPTRSGRQLRSRRRAV
jgi:hypothetical protein